MISSVSSFWRIENGVEARVIPVSARTNEAGIKKGSVKGSNLPFFLNFCKGISYYVRISYYVISQLDILVILRSKLRRFLRSRHHSSLLPPHGLLLPPQLHHRFQNGWAPHDGEPVETVRRPKGRAHHDLPLLQILQNLGKSPSIVLFFSQVRRLPDRRRKNHRKKSWKNLKEFKPQLFHHLCEL